MQTSLSDLYRNRLGRYTAAMRNEQPDCVPIRPFVAEFTSVYAGYTCQQTALDDRLGFDAALKTARRTTGCRCPEHDCDLDRHDAGLRFEFEGMERRGWPPTG